MLGIPVICGYIALRAATTPAEPPLSVTGCCLVRSLQGLGGEEKEASSETAEAHPDNCTDTPDNAENCWLIILVGEGKQQQ